MSNKPCSVWIGYDPRETAGFAVARFSAKRHMAMRLPTRGLVLDNLRRDGLYRREMQTRAGPMGHPILWDPISEAPCSTEFAISRFLVPILAKEGWAMFMDCDVLVRANLNRVFDSLDPSKALYCVKRREMPDASGTKMDGQMQVPYRRKLWSSVCIWNCEHSATRALTLNMVNTWPGRDLHAFTWIDDTEIGELDPAWNHLADIDPVPACGPKIVHYTLGTPDMEGHDGGSFSEEWWTELNLWASV